MDVQTHEGSHLRTRKLGHEFDRTGRQAALTMLEAADANGEVLTRVLFVNTNKPTFIDLLNMVDEPVATLPQSRTGAGRSHGRAAVGAGHAPGPISR
jgi:2-oxoglutarate ferredoxin oxidoreductase subunit beta